MWALFSRRFRRWLLMAVAVPLIGTLARRLSERLEERHGATRASRVLGHVGNVAKSPKQRKQSQRQGSKR
jgi:hypothetical protein